MKMYRFYCSIRRSCKKKETQFSFWLLGDTLQWKYRVSLSKDFAYSRHRDNMWLNHPSKPFQGKGREDILIDIAEKS